MRTLLLPFLVACGGTPHFLETGDCEASYAAGPSISSCPVPGWEGRDYDLVLPDAYEPGTPVPLVLAFHGGGGNRQHAARTTCGSGEADDPSCLHLHAQAHGYALAFPDGTGSPLSPNRRTWNAGGGVEDWRCTSGHACEEGVDDMAYVDALLEDIEGRVAVDPLRIHATGLSNGGAISHRLACERAERIASIAPTGGAMQLTTSDACAPSEPVAVMHSHGTADPAWRYEGGEPDTRITGQPGKSHVSVERTMDEWATILGCTGDPATEALPDTSEDGTSTTRHTWPGCTAELVLNEVSGGGHAWPSGYQYLSARTIGPVWTDWGNEVIWAFFEANPKATD